MLADRAAGPQLVVIVFTAVGDTGGHRITLRMQTDKLNVSGIITLLLTILVRFQVGAGILNLPTIPTSALGTK
jgi:hypothetical protein